MSLEPARAVSAGFPGRPRRAARAGERPGRVARLVYLRDMTSCLVSRELARRYRRSFLGWLWALGPPLIQIAVFHFVFTKVIPLDVPNFAVFLLVGIVSWNLFANGVSSAIGSLESSRELVLRPGFPTLLLPVVSLVVCLVDYVLALPVVLAAAVIVAGPQPTALLLPALIGMQMLLALGLGWILSPAHVFFRDVQHLVGVALMVGFWLTPVFYTADTVPDSFGIIYDLNPIAQLIGAERSVLLDGTLPHLLPLLAILAAGVALVVLGYAVFRACRDSIPEEL